MPFYDFRCTKCGHTFEDMLSITAPNPPCPNTTGEAQFEGDIIGLCGGETVKVPSRLSRVDGAFTPIHYPNRGAR